MAKNIVFCADGTWSHPGETEKGLPADTNVYKFFKALTQSATQAAHYDDGVGADGTPIDRLMGAAIGDGLFRKIRDGYTVIARSYDDGDGIHLFGFSRGAYTARSLAGMIAICGLPAPGKFTDAATREAFAAYRAGAHRQKLLDSFVARYEARDVKIDMLGVWDTVGALGIPGGLFAGLDEQFYGFLDTSLHPDVQAACHALSIDERRPEFVPTLWTSAAPGQEPDQLWFAGVHGDVGGGYAATGLSDIALGWMMAKARDRGLDFDPAVLARYTALDPKHALDRMHESWTLAWGFPKRREIPANARIANSAAIRIESLPGYRPPNLPADFPAQPNGHVIERVIADPASVFQLITMMQGVTTRGTGVPAPWRWPGPGPRSPANRGVMGPLLPKPRGGRYSRRAGAVRRSQSVPGRREEDA
jgi:hypothetical protein